MKTKWNKQMLMNWMIATKKLKKKLEKAGNLTNTVPLDDYKLLATSFFKDRLDIIFTELKQLGKSMITEAEAAAIHKRLFSLLCVKECITISGYFETDKEKVGSIVEVLLINSIALEQTNLQLFPAVTIDGCYELLMDFIKTLAPEINEGSLKERTKAYLEQLLEAANIEGRIPNLILYHVYTSPLPDAINPLGSWPGDIKQYFNFLRGHAFVCLSLKAAFQNYRRISMASQREISREHFELTCIGLFNYGEVKLPPQIERATSNPPTKLEFLQFVQSKTTFYLDLCPYPKITETMYEY